jgi:hypothetical protein
MRFKSYRFTDAALGMARAVGVYGDTAARLGRMLKRAAPFTSPLGNRRFQEFSFRVEEDLVTAVYRLETQDRAA